ncbi:MAG: glycosyltransferase family 4 protein [Chloroflexi bacterium]|nr:glycosyltransferase family 4 protein [Chloroflexota bacterium]
MDHRRIRLLAINGYGAVEGDVQTLLWGLEGFEAEPIDLFVVSKPRGEVYERLKSLPHVRLIPMELGGAEALPPRRNQRYWQTIHLFSAVLKTVLLVRKHHIEVVYSIDRGVSPQLAALVSRVTGIPFVLTAAYPFYPRNGLMARFVLRQAARIPVHSCYLLEYLKPYVKDATVFSVIPYGLKLDRYDPGLDGSRVRRAYNIAPDEAMVVMMGRLNQYKGQDDLIKAAAIVVDQYPNAHFLISGRGPEALKRHLEGLIADLNVGRQVKLVGYVPSVSEFVAAADIVTMPSWEEPFGLVALEGMAMAKPVVSTRAGGVPEFVIDRQVGLLVPPRQPAELAQAIIQLIADPARAKAMGYEGRQRVEKYYTAQRYIDRMTEVIRSAVSG